jgi:ribosomal-protein-alanine N-acetyltransferase
VAQRFSVRLPQLGDLRSLVEVELLCFADPWPPQFFISEILAEGRFNRVAVDEKGALAAYLFCAWQYLDLHVLKVGTLPGLRRTGLGRRLMQLAEEHAVEMGGESLTLEVRPTNHAAIALYEALDYERMGTRPRYYSDGEDALVMTKRISG